MKQVTGEFDMYIAFRGGFLIYIWPLIKMLLKAIFYSVLFVFISRSIKKGEPVKSKLFIFALLGIIALQLLSFKPELSKLLSFALNLISTLCFVVLVYYAFFLKLKKLKSGQLSIDETRICVMAIAGYGLLIVTAFISAIYGTSAIIYTIRYFNYSYAIYIDAGVGIRWLISELYGIGLFIAGLAELIILIILLKSKLKITKKTTKSINILLIILFIGLVLQTIGTFAFSGVYLYIIAIILAIYNRNQNKLFDNVGKRILKKAVSGVKTAIDNHFKFN